MTSSNHPLNQKTLQRLLIKRFGMAVATYLSITAIVLVGVIPVVLLMRQTERSAPGAP